MKIRGKTKGEKIEPQMAPMIDVVFQLLIFFMLTLKIIPPEGDFNINMPISAPDSNTTEVQLPDVKVRMLSDRNGNLAELRFGNASLGNDVNEKLPDGSANPRYVFGMLNSEILKTIGRPGNPLTKDLEVEIESDYELHYTHTANAIGACMGRFDSKAGKPVRYIEKVKFAPPKPPRS